VTGNKLDIVILGLSITSSWGNGHATTFRGLMRGLSARGHRVLFLERDVPWYAENRDLAEPPWGRTCLYQSFRDLRERWHDAIRDADLVIVGSFVPDGEVVGRWVLGVATGVRAFYDIDTPVTLATLRDGSCAYISADLIPAYDLYLSFTGGPVLEQLERDLGAPLARPLYCSADPELHRPLKRPLRYDLGYMGTYSVDRQPALDRLLVDVAKQWPAGRFVVAGSLYPPDVHWPQNVERIEHLPPARHVPFYNEQRFTLNLTRQEMVRVGWAPSVRLFEAAACGTPIISDWWEGLDCFLIPGHEVLIAERAEDVLRYLRELSDDERRAIGRRGREAILARHTANHRAMELEGYFLEARSLKRRRAQKGSGRSSSKMTTPGTAR